MKYLSTRREAIEAGESYYFTGKPCKHGHISKRHVVSCSCYECERAFAQKEESKAKRAAYNRTEKQKEKSRISAKRYHREHRDQCLKKMKIRNKKYYAENKERIIQQVLAYQSEHAAERTKYKKQWHNNKIKTDPLYRLAFHCRRMLHRALGLAGQISYKYTEEYLPYTRDQLVKCIENQFKSGMTWDNYGKWHIDHKRPIRHCVKNGITNPAIINGLDNLQPLWAKENMSKGDKIITIVGF